MSILDYGVGLFCYKKTRIPLFRSITTRSVAIKSLWETSAAHDISHNRIEVCHHQDTLFELHMWRSLLSRLGLAGAVRSPASAKALDTIINSTNTVGSSATRASMASTDKKTAAHAALRDAVRELSEGTATTISPPPRETMIALSGEDPQNLKVDELCALASATFQGVPDIIAADPTKAIELWRLAAKRGSLDATYSLAVCLRDGKGTMKDPTTAYTMLAKLANDHNYNIAHVSDE